MIAPKRFVLWPGFIALSGNRPDNLGLFVSAQDLLDHYKVRTHGFGSVPTIVRNRPSSDEELKQAMEWEALAGDVNLFPRQDGVYNLEAIINPDKLQLAALRDQVIKVENAISMMWPNIEALKEPAIKKAMTDSYSYLMSQIDVVRTDVNIQAKQVS